MHSLSTQASAHQNCLAGWQCGGVTAEAFLQKGSQADFFEHIKVVVGGSAVRADADV